MPWVAMYLTMATPTHATTTATEKPPMSDGDMASNSSKNTRPKTMRKMVNEHW